MGNQDWAPALFATLRKTALSIFDAHTEASATDNTRQALVARARGHLLSKLSSILKEGEKDAA